jgi:hypothetical protein
VDNYVNIVQETAHGAEINRQATLSAKHTAKLGHRVVVLKFERYTAFTLRVRQTAQQQIDDASLTARDSIAGKNPLRPEVVIIRKFAQRGSYRRLTMY